MTAVFLTAFILGLVVTVLVMLVGVERNSASVSVAYPEPGRPAPRIRYWVAVLAGFATVFGAAGYLLDRHTALASAVVLGIAVALGIVAAIGMLRLVEKARAFVPEHDPDDPRYIVQGHVAEVTRTIDGDAEGEILFTIGEGEVRRVRARGIEGARAEIGSEVVIEKIEDDVAYVEPWSIVEKRL